MPADSYAVAFPVGEISRPRRTGQNGDSGKQNPMIEEGLLGSAEQPH